MIIFWKTLDKLKPGGIIAFVTSKGTLDKENISVRKYIAERAELIGAIRLPNTAFKSIANTEVTTDIIFLQKREQAIIVEPDWIFLSITKDGVPVNQYYIDNPHMMLGEMVFDKSMYGNEKETALVNNDPDFNLEKSLDNAIKKLKIRDIVRTNITKDIDVLPANPEVKNYTYTIVNDELYFRSDNIMKKAEIPAKYIDRVKSLHNIREAK